MKEIELYQFIREKPFWIGSCCFIVFECCLVLFTSLFCSHHFLKGKSCQMMEAICSLFELFNNPLLLLKAPFPLLGMRYKESVTLSARALLNLPYFF